MRRVRWLALALVALAVAGVVGAGVAPPALGWPARLAVVFALPFAAGVVASLVLPRSPRRLGRSVRVGGTSRFHLVVLAAVLLDLGAIGAGYALGWTTFTFGDQRLEAWKLVAVPLALPFTIMVATLGAEWALHARLWSVGVRQGQGGEATLWALVAGVALASPAILPGFAVADRAYVAAALSTALAREATALLLFRAGGLFPAGAYRGTLLAVDAFGLNDWYGFFFPMANYVSSEPLFYLLRAAGPLAALALVAALARARGDEAPS
jgi:hypothetical protein